MPKTTSPSREWLSGALNRNNTRAKTAKNRAWKESPRRAQPSFRVLTLIADREIQAYRTPPDMHVPMYLLANLAVGGPWAGAPDATTVFPAHMQIDFIRAYRQEA